MHIILLGIVMLSFPQYADAQVAGMNTLSLLQTPSSARVAALGVDRLSVYAPTDLNVGIDNPSLISESYSNRLALNYVGLFSGSKSGSVSYGYKSKILGAFLFGLHFNSYGRFRAFDEAEVELGTFRAADIALSVGWALNIDSNFSIGASLLPVVSQYESYTAVALAMNVAGSYVSDDKRFSATLMASNIGAQIVTFDGTAESLPFNLSASCSYKADNAPFRVFLQLDHLTKWNLSYEDPLNPSVVIDPYTNEPVAKPWYSGVSDVLDGVARHASLGVEADIKNIFFLRLGYRYRQMVEMSADDRTNINFSGFSYGFGLRTKKFEFSFARRNYHLGQAPNYISLSFKF